MLFLCFLNGQRCEYASSGRPKTSQPSKAPSNGPTAAISCCIPARASNQDWNDIVSLNKRDVIGFRLVVLKKRMKGIERKPQRRKIRRPHRIRPFRYIFSCFVGGIHTLHPMSLILEEDDNDAPHMSLLSQSHRHFTRRQLSYVTHDCKNPFTNGNTSQMA
jgi:hypothetical protein